jgi:hypothetical protein
VIEQEVTKTEDLRQKLAELRTELVKSPQPHRDAMRFKFFDIFAGIAELSPILCVSIPRISVRLEMALFKTNPNLRDYASKARSLLFNLNDKKNPDLKLRVL